MTKRQDILVAAERAFEARGFHAVPMDTIICAANVSPRTLYKHFGSKTDLAVAVLERRHERFLGAIREATTDADDPVASLFDALEDWLETMSSSGCLFLRAWGEFGDVAVASAVSTYKAALRDLLNELVVRLDAHTEKIDALIVLIEGATAAAPTLGAKAAVDAARATAKVLFP